MPRRFWVSGFVRGAEIGGTARVEVGEDVLTLAWENASPWLFERAALEGAVERNGEVLLYLIGGDTLELKPEISEVTPATSDAGSGANPDVSSGLVEQLYSLPELTRGLRSFAATHDKAALRHDLWFGALLDARKKVAGSGDPGLQVDTFDARLLDDSLARVIQEIAAGMAPEGGARYRGAEAMLEEASEPFRKAILALEPLAAAVKSASDDVRMSHWRTWTEQLSRVFRAADECWFACDALEGALGSHDASLTHG